MTKEKLLTLGKEVLNEFDRIWPTESTLDTTKRPRWWRYQELLRMIEEIKANALKEHRGFAGTMFSDCDDLNDHPDVLKKVYIFHEAFKDYRTISGYGINEAYNYAKAQ